MCVNKLWIPEDFEVSTYYNEISARKNKVRDYSGTDNTKKCKYTFNEFGFRADSIEKEGFKVMSIGCSVTEGVGVNDDETWPSIFSSLVLNGVNLNFAYGGRSNDYIARCLLTFYDFIKPDLVLILYTEPHRREFYTEKGGVEPFHVKKWGYFENEGILEHESLVTLSNIENDYQNWYKNHQLISLFLKSKNTKWVWDTWRTNTNYSDENRFNGDYEPFIDLGVDLIHGGPKTNKKYAIDVYKHINDKFPNFLPKKTLL